MITTDSGKYALRALTNMAEREDLHRPVAAAEIAGQEGIPPSYLAKVMQDLARARLLKSVRGRGGGFVFRRPPVETTVLAVLAAMNDIGELRHDCVLGLDECNDAAACPMHDQWKVFRTALLERLETLTVADLATELARKRAANP